MLFLTYWELNEKNMSSEVQLKATSKLVESGLFPPKNINILRWDTTPDGWGVTLIEAENVADIFESLNLWRAAAPGIFKVTKIAPAMPVKDLMGQMGQILEKLSQEQVSG